MADETTQDLVDLLCNEFGRATTDSDTRLRMLKALQEAYFEVFSVTEWPWARSNTNLPLLSGQSTYLMEPETARVELMNLVTGELVEEIDLKTWDRVYRRAEGTAAASPLAWSHCVDDTTADLTRLHVWPTPLNNITVTIRRKLRPTILIDADTKVAAYPVPVRSTNYCAGGQQSGQRSQF
jgi:hypothetical protein